MSKITYVIGDATCFHQAPNRSVQLYDGATADIIAHIVNNAGAWGAGFTASIDAHFGKWGWATYREAWQSMRSDPVLLMALGGMLGNVAVPRMPPDHPNSRIFIAHMFAQDGVRSRANPRPFQLAALEKCVSKLSEFITQATIGGEKPGWARVHMPRIGTGLGGGRWIDIEPQIKRLARSAPVYVYDLPA